MQCNLIQCESRFGLMWCANDIISFAYKFCFRSTKYTKALCVCVSVCARVSMLHQQFDPSHPLLHSFTLYFTPRKCSKLQIKFRHCNQLAMLWRQNIYTFFFGKDKFQKKKSNKIEITKPKLKRQRKIHHLNCNPKNVEAHIFYSLLLHFVEKCINIFINCCV